MRIENPENWPIIYQDDFESDREDWITGDREIEDLIISLAIRNGHYEIDAQAIGDLTLYLVNSKYFTQDVYYSAEVYLEDVPANEDFGLIFRHSDGSNYGGFGISSDGRFVVYFKVDDEFSKPIDFQQSTIIEQNNWNTLAVLISGDQYTFYINETMVGNLTETRLTGERYGFGFQLRKGESVSVLFDNFIVHENISP